jgi:copper resistance protein B
MNARVRKRLHRAWLACMALAMPLAGRGQDVASMTLDDAPSPGMQGMQMNDGGSRGMLLVDQWELASGYDGRGPAWEAEAWYGGDSDKLWVRSEGEGSHGRIQDGDVEMLWHHATAAFWSTQLGMRHDVGVGAHRNWAAFGIEGLAPYWIELEATAYVGDAGHVAARGRAQYTLRFTQRLMLQPELEINLYDRQHARPGDDGNVSDAQLGLRLRYEITRQFAPYAGVVWVRRFDGRETGIAQDRVPAFDRRLVAGIRFWF